MAEPPSILGVSSRRSACDKCRFSKSRCLRSDPDQPKCDRCTRAEHECMTSPIFRVRDCQPDRISGSTLRRKSTSNKRRDGAERSLVGGDMIASPAAVDSSVITENYPSRRGSRDTRSDGNIQLALPEPSVSQQGTDAYAEETFDFMECNMEDTLTGFTPPDDFFATMGEYASDAHDVTRSMPLLSPLNTPMADKATNTLTEDSISPSRTSPFDKMSSNDQCDPLRQLSQLDHDLIVLCSKLEQATPEVLMHALFEVGEGDSSYSGVMKDILEKTTRYVDILSLLSTACIPHTEGSSPSSKQTSPIAYSRRVSTVSSSTYSAPRSDPTASPRQETNDARRAASSGSGHAHLELNTPSLLLILASYSRIFGMYLTVFSHIYQYLKNISESDNPRLRPISGLTISNYSTHSGNLQMLILIEIVTSHFENMEMLLGLPIELSISRRRGEREGLFGAFGFLDLTTAILAREDDETLGRGKGGIIALRRYIARARSLLKERIAP